MGSTVGEIGRKVSAYLISAVIVSVFYGVLFGETFWYHSVGNVGFSILPLMFGYYANNSTNRRDLIFYQNIILMSIYLLLGELSYAYISLSRFNENGSTYLLLSHSIAAFLIYRFGIKFFHPKHQVPPTQEGQQGEV